ncbi:MAG: hypothetical protein AAF390_18070 [Pseudomonadota bacterium]
MTALVWIGAALAVCGLAGLAWCIVVAARAKRAGLEGAAMEARLRGLVAVNLAALAVSALGLMMVVLGVVLG